MGIDPESLASALAKLEKASGTKKVASGYLSTHPGTDERIAVIRAAETRLGPADYPLMVKRAGFFARTNSRPPVSMYREGLQAEEAGSHGQLYDAGIAAASAADPGSAFPWPEEAILGGLQGPPKAALRARSSTACIRIPDGCSSKPTPTFYSRTPATKIGARQTAE